VTLPPPLSPHDAATADAQALHALDDGYYGLFEIAKLRASPDNRKRFNEQALQELAASIKSMGVAQPILIRPVAPTDEDPAIFEIVAGERRFRASKIAGMETIPAMCRTLSNLDAAKIRILENLQREDPHPMEEAEGYQLLMLQHGFTADQLVDEVKKSRAYIYGRLKLCALTPEVREQFLEDKIPASTALLIARIPVPALQAKALGEILNPPVWQGNEPLSYRKAVEHIQTRYMLDLSTAVFKLNDGKLLAAAGSCVKCPKRAGNQPELFPGVRADVCTDPECFAEKKAAHHNATIVEANKAGVPVHEGLEGLKLHEASWQRSAELVNTNAHISYFARNAPSTGNQGVIGKYLDDEALPPVAAYVKNKAGEPVPLYSRESIQSALEAVGACETVEGHAERMRAIEADPSKAPPKSDFQLRQEQEQLERQAAFEAAEKESAFRLALYKQLRQRASIDGLGLASLREYTKAVTEEHDLKAVLHDLYEHDVRTDLDSFIATADSGTLQLLLIDLFLGSMLKVDWYALKNGTAGDDGFETIMAMSRHEGIDPVQVREELFPSPIDVTPMQYGDLVAFIGNYPQRLAELTSIVLEHPRGELVGMLERAATEHGYVYKDRAFVRLDETPAEAPEPPAALAVDTAAPMVGDGSDAADDADDLAEQLEQVEAAKPVTKATNPKSTKSKAAPAATKDAKKAASAKSSGKTTRKAPAAAYDDSPWPFPKSSTEPRDGATVGSPAGTEVAA